MKKFLCIAIAVISLSLSASERKPGIQLKLDWDLVSKKIVHFTNTEGLQSMEDDVLDSKDYLFKQGIQLVVDGTDPDTVKKILRSYVESSGYTGKKLLKQILIAEGILAIQNKDTP